jgi:hypothetical protein
LNITVRISAFEGMTRFESKRKMPRDKDSRKLRIVRHRRVRNKVHGTPDRPRLCVFRSLKGIYAQVIDDVAGHTLAYASSREVGGEDATPPAKEGLYSDGFSSNT